MYFLLDLLSYPRSANIVVMKYTKFTIKNFKGIKNLNFSLENVPSSRIITLVGLNESGKTTVLEALSQFYDEFKDKTIIDEKALSDKAPDDVHDLIPKSLKDNFNGEIVLDVDILLNDEEVKSIKDLLQKKNFVPTKLKPNMSVLIQYSFKDSRFQKKSRSYRISIDGYFKEKGKKRVSKRLYESDKDLWTEVTNVILKWLPPIIYYPNFLFDFPDRIYLTEIQNEGKEQSFYRRFLQDVLDSLQNNLLLEEHIINRAASNEPQDRESLDSVKNKMSSQISKLVFNKKLSVFQSDMRGKSIEVTYPQYDESNKAFYISIKLRDGDDTYYIRERSLGFRWFFTFLLLTQFRVTRAQGEAPVFVFDEPASNLHQTAQQRLIRALDELIQKSSCSVVYTTHSHHLIEPNWLEGAYIVKNRALDVEKDDNYTANMTDVAIEGYRTFVGSYPDQRTYFQPILDVLEYKPSNLENIPDIVMVEGKSDFYALKYFQEVILESDIKLNLLPGMGAGGLDLAIQLYYAWGRNFIILLDSDGEGEKQKQRYLEKFGSIVSSRIFLFRDINGEWSKHGMEKVIGDSDGLKIHRSAFPDSEKLKKKELHLAIQENLVNRRFVEVSEDTNTNFTSIIEFLNNKLKEPYSANTASG
jgi:ABC-type Mn2+/Zn2+ transport system ATPase subunit/5S rRNA maturation endonuclease (ribonuclease M5)